MSEDKVTALQLEERYTKTSTRLLHVEKQLESVDSELVDLLSRMQDQRYFDDEDIEEVNRIQKLWDDLYTELIKLKKEKYSVSDKLRKQYIVEMKTTYNSCVKSDLKLTTNYPVRTSLLFIQNHLSLLLNSSLAVVRSAFLSFTN